MALAQTLRSQFLLDPDVVYLNHGAYGACPEPVFAVYQERQRELEFNPTAFLGERIGSLLADARAALGAYVHADADDLVFVPNATTGVNLAAWALDLRDGDEVVSTGLEYGACDLAFRHILPHFGARYIAARVPLPVRDADEIVDAVFAAVTDRTKALFVSHVTSETALRLPVERLVTRAREAGLATISAPTTTPGTATNGSARRRAPASCTCDGSCRSGSSPRSSAGATRATRRSCRASKSRGREIPPHT